MVSSSDIVVGGYSVVVLSVVSGVLTFSSCCSSSSASHAFSSGLPLLKFIMGRLLNIIVVISGPPGVGVGVGVGGSRVGSTEAGDGTTKGCFCL